MRILFQMARGRLWKSLRRLVLLGFLGVVLAAPAPGFAAPAPGFAATTVPPGNSEIDQYTETLPGAAGNQPTGGSGGGAVGGTKSTGGPVLSPAVAQKLRRRGPAGRAVAKLTEATAPRLPASTESGRGQGSGSGLDAVARTVSGSDGGGLGILLPLILGGVTAAAVAYMLLRWRARLPG